MTTRSKEIEISVNFTGRVSTLNYRSIGDRWFIRTMAEMQRASGLLCEQSCLKNDTEVAIDQSNRWSRVHPCVESRPAWKAIHDGHVANLAKPFDELTDAYIHPKIPALVEAIRSKPRHPEGEPA